MATLSISGDNASYTLTLSGMSTSKRYHVFVADLNSDGTANGYYCRRSSIGSSSSWTYSGSSSSSYSGYPRLVQVYQTDSATPFNVGTKYTSSQISSGLSGTGWSTVASEYIPAASTSSTLTVNMPSVVNSITFTNGNTATNRSGTGYISYSSAVKISSVSIAGGYSSWSGTLYWSNGTNTFAFATVNNGSVSVYNTSSQESIDYTGNRTITVTAVQSSTTIYYKYRYIVESTGATLEDSSVYSTSTTLSPAVAYITLSDIPQPTNTDYIKTGSYSGEAHCSINVSSDYASCTGTSASDPSIIGVKVQFNRKIFYYQYQYIKPDGSILETSNVYAQDASLSTTYISVILSDIPQPSTSGYTKTGSYRGIAHCSINTESDYASCSSTSTSDPSIIGVEVRPTVKIFYYQYRYLTPNGVTIKDSNIYAQDATYSTSQISVRLADIPGPNVGRWEKSGQYSGVAHCSINMEGGYALCSSTSTADPSIIGVYCEQEPIDRFTWLGSDLQDNAAFASGKYISDAITASGWNTMYEKIKELAEATGGQFDYDAVSKGDAITATEFNYMRWGIINLPWHGSLPNAVAAEMPIFADYFNGSVSLKSALNAAIDGFNNQ